MTEEKKNIDLLTLGIGVILGATLIYLLLKSRQTTLSQSLQNQKQIQPIWQNPQNISDVDQLQVQQPVQVPISQHMYKNHEKWKVIRNVDGDIDSIEVIRNAEINANK